MKYCIQKYNPSTARIAFESSSPFSPQNKPTIFRFYSSKSNPITTNVGTVLGRDTGMPCALMIHVKPHDLISIQESIPGMVGDSLRYYRIQADFQPQLIDDRSGISALRVGHTLLNVGSTTKLNQLDSTKDSLKLFLVQKHPTWLQKIVNRQIERWRDHFPSSFFRLASSQLIKRALPKTVETSPFSALAFAQAHLNDEQLASCIIQSKVAALMFAFDRIPTSKRREYISAHPKVAVEYAADHLTDQEFRFAVQLDRFSAFRCLQKLPPFRQATILAFSYPYAFLSNYGGSLPRLQQTILTSLKSYPEEWIICDNRGFELLFKGLRDWVKLEIDSASIVILLDLLNPKNHAALTKYICSRI